MNREQIETLVRRWMSFWQGADLASFDDVHTADFVDRSSSGRPTDRAGFKSGVQELYRGLPDFFAQIDDILVDEARQRAAVRWHGSGTHRGPLMGIAATGARLDFVGIEIIRVAGGGVAERWGEMDSAAVAKQLEQAARRGSTPRA